MNYSVLAPTLGAGYCVPTPSTMAFTLKKKLKSSLDIDTQISVCQSLVASMFNFESFEALKSVESSVANATGSERLGGSDLSTQGDSRLLILASSDGPCYDVHLLVTPDVDFEILRRDVERFLRVEADLENRLNDGCTESLALYDKLMGGATSIAEFFRLYGPERFGVRLLEPSADIALDSGHLRLASEYGLTEAQADVDYVLGLRREQKSPVAAVQARSPLNYAITPDEPDDLGCENFTLNAGSGWLRVGSLSVWFRKTHEGVIMDVWPLSGASNQPMASLGFENGDVLAEIENSGCEGQMVSFAQAYGVSISEDVDQPGLWVWTSDLGRACESSLSSVGEAFADAYEVMIEKMAWKGAV